MSIAEKLQTNNRVSSRNNPYSLDECEDLYQSFLASSMNHSQYAKEVGVSVGKLRYILRRRLELIEKISSDAPFVVRKEDVGDDIADVDDIIARRRREFNRRDKATKSNALIPCFVNIKGPVGILHMGDNHVDDPGTDINLLQKHIDLINGTEGLFGANVGDMANHCVGRLARLHAYQSTTEAETWRLVEWLMTSVDWLYIIGGNHDMWVGDGDPIQWMVRNQMGVYKSHGARIELTFPNGNSAIINARHDWPGHSQYNPAHGPAKAIQRGVTDHIVIAGHKHITGYQILKNPLSGVISHALRVASYKIHDDYATALGLPDQNISPAVLTIIDPEKNQNDPGMINVFHDVDSGVEFLKFLRKKYASINQESQGKV